MYMQIKVLLVSFFLLKYQIIGLPRTKVPVIVAENTKTSSMKIGINMLFSVFIGLFER